MPKRGQRMILLEFMKNQIRINERLRGGLLAVSVGMEFTPHANAEVHSLIDLQQVNIKTLREIMEADAKESI
jgi:hypothetical protein